MDISDEELEGVRSATNQDFEGDSGNSESSFEISGSDDELKASKRKSSPGTERGRSNVSRRHDQIFRKPGGEDSGDNDRSLSNDNHELVDSQASNHDPENGYTDERIRADAITWASTFEPPSEIALPRRDSTSRPNSKVRGTRSKKQREAKQAARAFKAKDKILKGAYNEEYAKLFNDDCQDVDSQNVKQSQLKKLTTSQIGSSIWTSHEKEAFFAALSRLGRDRTQEIARRIKTKSEPEVIYFMQLLQKGLIHRSLHKARPELLSIADFPAAVQISEEGCEALGLAAESLSRRVDRIDERKEQATAVKLGIPCLVNKDGAQVIEEILARAEVDTHIGPDLFEAAHYLKLTNWLELSEKIFMNPAGDLEEGNWRSITHSADEIGINATALDDFHNILRNLTRKLVSTTIFIANSRIRYQPLQKSSLVKKADVLAAVRTLGLKRNSRQFWIKCARRNHIDVYDGMKEETIMRYKDVEKLLKHRGRIPKTSSVHGEISDVEMEEVEAQSTEPEDDETDDTEDSESSDDNGPDGISYDGTDPSDNESPRNLGVEYLNINRSEDNESDSDTELLKHQAAREIQRELEAREQEKAQEEYMEALDIKASLVSEKDLWKLFDKQPPFTIEPEQVEVPIRPPNSRKEAEDMIDWRERLENLRRWEILSPAQFPDFKHQRVRKRKRSIDTERSGKTRKSEKVQEKEQLMKDAAFGTQDVSDGSENLQRDSGSEADSSSNEHS